MRVIVGLGNPGQTYHGTRHNAGFMVIELLAERHKIRLLNRTAGPVEGHPAAIAGEYANGTQTVRLVMPLTMMNESGEALAGVEINRQELLIVCDDVNLPLGTLRMRPEGSAGGHHGLQSCLEVLGTEQVPRLRIGVGTGALPKELRDFVLSPFERRERPLAEQMMAQAADACELWVKEGMDVTMNRYNRAQTA